jgi:hypothetical protein
MAHYTALVISMLAIACRDRSAVVAELDAHAHPARGGTLSSDARRAKGADCASAPDAKTAMEALLAAVRSGRSHALLACFSKTRPWSYLSDGPGGGKPSSMSVTYKSLATGMVPRGDYHGLFFDEDRELSRHSDEGQEWIDVGNLTFVPKDDAASPETANVRIRWRREGERFVVASIFESGS